jgi:TldD protein
MFSTTLSPREQAMRLTCPIAVVVLAVLSVPVLADKAGGDETQKDVVLRALVDELARSRDELKLEDLERPYFIEFSLNDAASASVTAKLGTITDRGDMRSRSLRTDVRVGSYELDNTNFQGDMGFSFGGEFGGRFGGASIPIEDDYYAIRQAIWWSTDRGYKSNVEALERKKAFMATKVIEDKPADFARAPAVTHFDERIDPKVDAAALEELALDLSKLFREHPEIQSSSVSLSAVRGNKYLVNTEGTRIRQSGRRCALSVSATVQSDDGMKLSDSISVVAKSFEELPDRDELAGKCRELIAGLIKLKDAPKLDAYSGPVLFDAPAATKLFSQQFGRRFLGGQRPVGGQTPPDEFEKKIGERILPKTFDVVDDPTLEKIEEQVVMGNYKYDDQGVKAQPVTLVEGGRLKALLMSRNPSKTFKESNGHGRGAYRPTSSIGCLVVRCKEGQDDDSLKEKLIDALEDEDKEFGIRIASLGAGGDFGGFARYASLFGGMDFDFSGFGGGPSPLAIYKVHKDGREELVRGAQLGNIDLKFFKKIIAAGKKPDVQNSSGGASTTVAAPAMLFEELDLTKIDRDFDKPPILPTPLARQ